VVKEQGYSTIKLRIVIDLAGNWKIGSKKMSSARTYIGEDPIA